MHILQIKIPKYTRNSSNYLVAIIVKQRKIKAIDYEVHQFHYLTGYENALWKPDDIFKVYQKT